MGRGMPFLFFVQDMWILDTTQDTMSRGHEPGWGGVDLLWCYGVLAFARELSSETPVNLHEKQMPFLAGMVTWLNYLP